MIRKALILGCVLTLSIASAQAAIVTLDLQLDTVAETWQVYALITGGSEGLSDFGLNVVGSGGAVVTGSTNKAPTATNFDGSEVTQYGFYDMRSNGVNGVGIVANQPSIYPGVNDPAKDALVLKDVGISAGSQAGNLISAVWAVPVLLAEGTYFGDLGTIVAAGAGTWNLLEDGWAGPGHLEPASGVLSGSVQIGEVPEPATMSLLVIGGLALLRRKR